MRSLAIALSTTALTALAMGAFVATEAQAKTKTATTPSPASLACSKQADAKGLHGQERKKFRAECKKEMKAKDSTSATGKTPTTPAPAKTY